MNGDMLITTLQAVSAHTLSWFAVVALLGLALCSFWRYRTIEAPKAATAEEAAEARAYLNSKVAQGPAHMAIMLAAIAAMIAGLAMVAKDVSPVIGFIMLIGGVIVAQVEPLRVRIRIAEARLRATAPDEHDSAESAREDLNDMHRSLVVTLFIITLCVAVALAVF